ncbi:Iron-sulfur cluster assembly scaffold protein IscU [Candidatus Xenohaliotis californiensis]|uniref:Iron-sulfur cluster assembly scaffold protein IscU n=1 Tax=Candidatus Xenohaliotis californiensis TaxID=84677 RepID=A0ABM9N8V5_9RICK|nr:Iron-sulfur cluster assembly scaffold protein IscU [Candidatus Xenohaliotis californiensis]
MKYNDNINNYYNNPQNIGSLDKNDPNVVRGKAGSAACGDLMTLDIKVDPVTRKILDAKVKTFGCMSAIASSTYLTTLIIGKTIEEARSITNKDIYNDLGLPAVKFHCSVLAEEVISDALLQYSIRFENKDSNCLPNNGKEESDSLLDEENKNEHYSLDSSLSN